MTTIEIATHLAPVLEQFAGRTFTEKIAGVLGREIHRNLMECEQSMLALEIRYGMGFLEFDRQLEAGQLGDEFQWPLEADAMRWQDLIEEKRHWLSQLRAVSVLSEQSANEH